jgi:hypothetical protein
MGYLLSATVISAFGMFIVLARRKKRAVFKVWVSKLFGLEVEVDDHLDPPPGSN